MKASFYLRPQNENFLIRIWKNWQWNALYLISMFRKNESNEDLEKSVFEITENIFSPKGKKYSIKTEAFVGA